MTREDHQQAVLAELRKQLARDRTRTTVSGFTQLGLVEMTRKRTRESLAHMLCEPCPTCQGRGQVKTARSVCYDILREILREARQFDPKEFRVVASAAVVEMLLDEESAAPGGAERIHRQADLAEHRADDESGAVRHCSDVGFHGVSRRPTCHPQTRMNAGDFGFRRIFRALDVSPSSTQIG